MHRLTALVGVVLIMALFQNLTAAGALEARATLALGFLLIAALLGGDLARRVGLPRVTGYLLIGLAVGPEWLGLVRADETQAMGFISDAAVALIALAAGGELKRETLRAQRRMLTRVSLAVTLTPLVIVTAVLLTVTPWMPLTAHQPLGDALAIVLVIGIITAAFSPAVTLAVMDETGARGPVASTVLAVTVLTNVGVAAAFALAVSLAQPLMSAGTLDLGVLVRAIGGLLGSVVAGVLVGVVMAAYLRRIQRDTPLFLVGIAFILAALSRQMGLDLVLPGLAAGFYLENFSRVEGDRLLGALQRGSAPVYVVFFALTGAHLHLAALAELWPWVLLVIGLRVQGLRLGMHWAGRDPIVTPDLARHGWLGFISQAGLALGVASLVRRAFPEWGVSLQTLIVAMIGVHEVFGPILFRRALRLAGEVRESVDDAAPVLVAQPAVADRRGGV